MENKSLFQELIEIQAELKVDKTRTNKFGNYKYRNQEDILKAVKPLLKDRGILLNLSDSVVCIEGRHYICATATIRKSGDGSFSVDAYAREAETKKGMSEEQITGSASSYARKYALNAMFLIDDSVDPDDDVNEKITGGARQDLEAMARDYIEHADYSDKKKAGLLAGLSGYSDSFLEGIISGKA